MTERYQRLDSLYSKVLNARQDPVTVTRDEVLAMIVIPEFHPARAEFEVAKSTGQLALIQTDSMFSRIMSLYEVTYGELDFIQDVNRITFTEHSWSEALREFPMQNFLRREGAGEIKLTFNAASKENLLSRIAFYQLAMRSGIPRFRSCSSEVNNLSRSVEARLMALE